MQRVISINLNGNAYQLDENGYNALFAYLDGAETQLQDNPDRAEIMADLEQAVAEKCSTYLGAHKTVITAAEVERIIAQMGPVDAGTGNASGTAGSNDAKAAGAKDQADGGNEKTASGSGAGASGKARTDAQRPRRLYRIPESAMIGGVCNGLAAYFVIDVTLVRIIFVLLAILTQGAWIAVYFTMMWFVPQASTPDERAAAHGMNFNAQDVIDQAKKNIEQFSRDFGKHDWGSRWRQRREWRRYYRAARWNPGMPPPGPLGVPGPFGPTAMGPFYGLLSLGLFIMLLVAIASLFDSGVVFGWPFFPGLPRWIGVLVLVVLFQFLVMPLRIARRVSYGSWYGPYNAWSGMWHGLIWVAMLLVGLWLADQYIPGVHDFLLDLNFGPVSRLR
jgi:phage shock protein PspC (stress-responsive transcriptional regulator)